MIKMRKISLLAFRFAEQTCLPAGRDKKFIPQSLRGELILLPQDN
jgi:hypothetical protein